MTIANDLTIYEGSGATGDMYYRDTTGKLVPVTGTQTTGYVPVKQAGGGIAWASPVGEQLIEERVLGGTSASETFSSIVATYRDLRVIVRGRGDKVATFVEVRLRVNGDTAGNYDFESMAVNNTTGTSSGAAAQTSALAGWVEAASSPANAATTTEIRIYDYRGTTFQKHASASSGVKTGTAAANFFSLRSDMWWRSTAAITSVTVFPDANNFIAGTVLSLYGIP